MIRVQSALMRDKIQRLLTDHQGSVQFSFDHEQGISLFLPLIHKMKNKQ